MKVVDNRPKFLKKNDTVDYRVSTCSICIKGIFKNQKYHWSKGKYCGLIHSSCEVK